VHRRSVTSAIAGVTLVALGASAWITHSVVSATHLQVRVRDAPAVSALPVASTDSDVVTPPSTQPVPGPPLDPLVAAHIASRIAPKYFGSHYSIEVQDALTGSNLYSKDASTPRLPASTMKLLTAFAALRTIDERTRYTTKVISLGSHDVAIVGGGDPMLTPDAISAMARSASASIERASGLPRCDEDRCPTVHVRVHYVDQLFGKFRLPPGWLDSYLGGNATPVAGLAMLGDYSTEPQANVARLLADDMSYGSVEATYVGAARTSSGDLVVAHTGPPLSAAVKYMLQHSENNIAEVLFRHVAIAAGQRPTFAGGATAVTGILTEAGLPMSGVQIADGSGLSRNDRVTASLLDAIISQALDHVANPGLHSIIHGGLPTAGASGTLGDRFNTRQSRCAQGQVWAKTGSLRDVVALAGYTRGTDKRLKIFTIVINAKKDSLDFADVRASVDRVVGAINGCS
jgi:serine-type D-Ala-D-Ala carboxypeptidase/endopeptidase (penicillin-binding protein 4)